MARQQKLIHLHGTSQLTKDKATAVGMVDGELAVKNDTQENSELYVLTIDGDIATFVTGANVAKQIKVESDRAEAAEAGLQGEIDAAEVRITTLEEKFTGEDSVAAQIAAAVKVESDRAKLAEKANADAIDAIEADYLKEEDKTELQTAINGKVAQTAYNEKMTALEQADTNNANAIKAISDDYLKEEDKTELQTAINGKVAQSAYDTKVAELVAADNANATAIDNHTKDGDIHVTKAQKEAWQAATDAINLFLDDKAVSDEVVNTLKEIQEYINTDGEAAADMLDAIAANADAIAANAAAIDAIEKDYLKEEDKTELQTAINGKVAQTAYNEKVAALEQADTDNATAIGNEVTRAEAAEKALQDAINAITGEDGSLADTLQAAIDYTDGLLGEGFTTENTVAAAIAAEKTRAEGAEQANANAIKAISDDYLKAADRTALEGQIATKVDKTAYDAKVAELVAADNAFTEALNAAKSRIKDLEDADYVKSVAVQNSNKNLITATKGEDGTVTLNFDNMVINCGEY